MRSSGATEPGESRSLEAAELRDNVEPGTALSLGVAKPRGPLSLGVCQWSRTGQVAKPGKLFTPSTKLSVNKRVCLTVDFSHLESLKANLVTGHG